ncbi:Multidrug resistance protein MexA precursor [Gemmata obscuriglobus]|nr:efflux RND transporter periplasmic adaptor subunit [Gemmata obscuriglobus]QEG28607.1 Multidrug resistance protein MexA precursor [Gemmata obscuriglobus]VTS06768.1 rnd transporter : Efflux transporter, RND family, MFP subunit OS=Methylobacter tundripaludum SV96 GN=Mettu_0196 PE=4 SV=1: HlyD [Gemmata obscuriglobus UQM 2246]
MRLLPLFALVVGLSALGCNKKPPAQSKDVGPPKVTVAAPLVRPVTEFTELTGTLAAVKTADIRARVNGYVQKVLFQEGAEVKAGARLIEIDPEPFQVALGLAEAGVKSAEAQREQAAANEARVNKTLMAGAASKEEYDQARANLLVSKANVEKSQKDVEQAKLNLSYTTIVAPFDGRVDRIFVNEGNVVTGGTGSGTVLTRVTTVDPTYAYFTVDEQTVLAYLRRAQREGRVSSAPGTGPPVEIQLRDETGYPHKGTIDFASSELSPSTGTLQIRGTFPNPAPRLLRPGLFVRGRIPLKTATEATLIPDDAVQSDQAERVVYVVGPNNRVAVKHVKLGPQSMGLRVVEGLAPADRVIINGLARIQPDMEIDPQPGEIKPRPDPAAQPSAPTGNAGPGAPPGASGSATDPPKSK